MLNPLENYFLQQEEPLQSCMLYLRDWLKKQNLEESYKFSTAFYSYKGKMFCYMSVRKKDKQFYLGFVQGYKMKHPSLKKEGRKQIKVYYINPEVDLPIKSRLEVIKVAKNLY